MHHIKMSSEISNNPEVQLKAKAGKKYCEAASAFTARYGGKPWKYLLIPHDAVKEGVFFDWLARQCEV